jgi:beta-galactosidase
MPRPTDAVPEPLPVKDPSRLLLDDGWLFHEGDVVPPALSTHDETYGAAKAGGARGAAAINFDDSKWQPVRLPHDWASFQPFVQTANVSQGYRPRGIGWYRRTIRLDPADRGKVILLQFGAIATHATIWVNGSVVAHNWSGYNGIEIDLTPFARFGDELNVIAVRVDATAMEGWWYEGAGIYRHAWLAIRSPVSIVTDGVHCNPRQGADGRWSVPVEATLTNIGRTAAQVEIEALLLDPDGRQIASARAAVSIGSLEKSVASLALDPGSPSLWSVEQPTLYTVEARVLADGKTVDQRRIAIGFRSIRFDPDKGFFLNDRPVKLKGVCIHQDHAGVGVAVPDALLRWRLERLKALGCNAIRCTHNAPAAEFLDLTDRMGFLVMDENRLFNPAPEYMAQLEWLVRRDRNHPSVILWSVFNEEPMQGTESGVEMVRRMAHVVKKLDDSRPVTAAMNGMFYNPVNVSSVVDVMGFNYYQNDYDRFHALNPAKPITSSEDTSAFETRGAFATDAAAHVISSYDTEAAAWGDTHRNTWKKIADRPFVAGGFVWTGFDYHGEPTPHKWPTVSSFFGIMDLCGFPKTAFDIHRAHWIDDRPVVSLAPHWTWPGREGQPVKIFVASNCEEVELRLNGRLLGAQRVDRIMGNEWSVPYAPGRIEVRAKRGGRVVVTAAHETAGPPVALRLTPARKRMAGDGEDVQPVTVDAVDSKGRHVPTANLPASFRVNGAAIIGLGNGDPNSHEPEKGFARSLFNGLAQVIIQADAGRGPIRLTATAPGLRLARLTIDRVAKKPRPRVPIARRTKKTGG